MTNITNLEEIIEIISNSLSRIEKFTVHDLTSKYGCLEALKTLYINAPSQLLLAIEMQQEKINLELVRRTL